MAELAILAAPPALADLCAAGKIAIFLDFDGTLVEIADTPDGIDVPGRLAQELESLSEFLGGRLALVSGRALDNIELHIGETVLAKAGSHGASRLTAEGVRLGEEPLPLPDPAMEELREFARSGSFDLEIKQHGAAIHYRSMPEREGEARIFAKELADRHGLALKYGKCVVELVQPGSGKDGAVHAFMQEETFAGATPVFIGDDITDEDGFRAAAELGGFGIIVGERTETLAKYRLETVRDVHRWLKLKR